MQKTQIKVISFDVWNTLIIPNPNYTEMRNIVASQFLDIPMDLWINIYKATKKQFEIEYFYNKDAYSLLKTNYINFTKAYGIEPSDINWDTLKRNFERLFMMYPPIVSETIKKKLWDIKSRGIKISIGSNTNFISGSVLHPFLVGSYLPFDNWVYSDLVGIQKPQQEFYTTIHELVSILDDTINCCNILHIGDDIVNDVVSPRRFGLKAKMVIFDSLQQTNFDHLLGKLENE